MAAQIYLLTRSGSQSPETNLINSIHSVLINSDDGSADSVKIAEAVAVCVAAGHPLHAGYFDTVFLVGPPTAGEMTTDEDCIIFLARSTTEVIA